MTEAQSSFAWNTARRRGKYRRAGSEPVYRRRGRIIRILNLGFVSLVATVLMPAGGAAQEDPKPFTLHPREAATGTQNPSAGDYQLAATPHAILSVPPRCVGARRCPLLVVYPGLGLAPRQSIEFHRAMMEKYGIILLAMSGDDGPVETLEAAVKEALGKFAIDPDKIGLTGHCASGSIGWRPGTLSVFSRIAALSATPHPVHLSSQGNGSIDPENKTGQIYIESGILEPADMLDDFMLARIARGEGHPVKLVVGIRGHEYQLEGYDFLGHWLQESWAAPSTPASGAATWTVAADSLPLLTPDMLTRMTAFWTRFGQQPDSILTTVRRAYLREVLVPVQTERPSVWMVDMAALAAHVPSVAADLKAAGLTPQEHDAYRVALLSALITKALKTMSAEKFIPESSLSGQSPAFIDALDTVRSEVAAIPASSRAGQNLAFVETHPDELTALELAGVDDPRRIHHATVADNYPLFTDAAVPLGIWRTP